MTASGFEHFEHTADIGIRATEAHPITLTADSGDELLMEWLKEPLFWFHTERFLSGAFRVAIIDGRVLRGWVDGERFDPARHGQGTEVKGITSRQLQLSKGASGWKARVIVDV